MTRLLAAAPHDPARCRIRIWHVVALVLAADAVLVATGAIDAHELAHYARTPLVVAFPGIAILLSPFIGLVSSG